MEEIYDQNYTEPPSLKPYLIALALGVAVTVISIIILPLNLPCLIIGGILLGLGLAILCNSLNQVWKRYEEGKKWFPFSWQSFITSAMIGLSTGIITTLFSLSRERLTSNFSGIA
jgi:hypothetical protein